jgi:hypothetical protein
MFASVATLLTAVQATMMVRRVGLRRSLTEAKATIVLRLLIGKGWLSEGVTRVGDTTIPCVIYMFNQ